jgi:hypothetical protein
VLILLFWLQKGAWIANFKVRLHNCPSQNVSDEYKPRRLIFSKVSEFIYSRINEAGLASDRIR